MVSRTLTVWTAQRQRAAGDTLQPARPGNDDHDNGDYDYGGDDDDDQEEDQYVVRNTQVV